MKNEKGFIYPVTMFICFLIIHILIVQINLYQTEKRFLYEQERLMQIESLLQVGITEFRKGKYEPLINKTILLSYESGTVALTTKNFNNGISQIHVKVKLNSGHERIAGFNYNWDKSEVDNYWEVVNPTVSGY